MKNVIAAVNELKGEWIYDEPSIVEQISTGNLSSWHELCDHGLNKDNFRLVCNEEEFNQCVDEMSKAEWIKPVTEDNVSCYVCHVGAFPMQQYCGSCGHELLSELIPVTSPIYTQAMANHNIFPLVGMECLVMYSSSNYKGTITYMGDGVGCFHSKDNDKEYTFALTSVKFKALTPPKTDTEKSIDDFVNFFNGTEMTESNHLYAELMKKIKAGKIHGVTFTGES
jgi:hypothetical protein